MRPVEIHGILILADCIIGLYSNIIYSYVSYKCLLLVTIERILLVPVNIWESMFLFCQISILVLGNHDYSR